MLREFASPSELRSRIPGEGGDRGQISRSLRHTSRRVWRRVWRPATRVARAAFARYTSASPRPGEEAGAERRVTILLFSAWGMGGTIRTVLNLAAYLANRYEVEIISVTRSREDPFFGEFPPGVKVVALDDKRLGTPNTGLTGATRRLMGACPSVLVHPSERWADYFSLWTDVRLARRLRRRDSGPPRW